MQITLSIQAPELVGAINNLALALGTTALGSKAPLPTIAEPSAPAVPVQPAQPAYTEPPAQPAYSQQPQQPAYGQQPQQPVYGQQPQQPAYTPAVPVAQPQQPPMQQPGAVPTTAPSYTFEQLGVAAGPLVDAGRSSELLAWLNQRGAAVLSSLDPALYGEFATFLRGLGAKI